MHTQSLLSMAFSSIEVRRAVSPKSHRISNRFRWGSSEGIFATILQNEGNSISKTAPCFFFCFALSIRPGNFRAISNKPFLILFDDRRKFVRHHTLP